MDSLTYISPILEDHHTGLRNKIREFAVDEIQPVAAELDRKGEFSPEITKRLGEMGLFGMTIPEKYGGGNHDTLSYIIAVEELARVDSSQAATVAAHNSLGIHPVLTYGTEEQRNAFLPMLTSGENVWAFALTEPHAGSDATNIKTHAKLSDGFWELNGTKVFITNSASISSAGATILAITGNTGEKKEISAILVRKESQGYQTHPIKDKMIWRAVDTGRILLSQCRVPCENLLGERGKGQRIMFETLDGGRLSIAAIGLGLAQGAFDMALRYAGLRRQFNQSIGKFQAIAFKLSEMAVKLELARNTLYKVCWQKDAGHSYSKEAAMAKLYCSEIAGEIVDEAVQIHGAYGLMKNYDIERFYRDQRILQIGEGTSEILKLLISRHLGL